jgi:hypothetical protein
LGQRALDPGACRVALTPFLRLLLAAGFLERLSLRRRIQGFLRLTTEGRFVADKARRACAKP